MQDRGKRILSSRICLPHDLFQSLLLGFHSIVPSKSVGVRCASPECASVAVLMSIMASARPFKYLRMTKSRPSYAVFMWFFVFIRM